jgi:hypothetical protein
MPEHLSKPSPVNTTPPARGLRRTTTPGGKKGWSLQDAIGPRLLGGRRLGSCVIWYCLHATGPVGRGHGHGVPALYYPRLAVGSVARIRGRSDSRCGRISGVDVGGGGSGTLGTHQINLPTARGLAQHSCGLLRVSATSGVSTRLPQSIGDVWYAKPSVPTAGATKAMLSSQGVGDRWSCMEPQRRV